MNPDESQKSELPRYSLDEIITAIEITRNELGFQLMRLDTHVTPRDERENEYHQDLKAGYTTAMYWIGILERYLRGRKSRERGGSLNDLNQGE